MHPDTWPPDVHHRESQRQRYRRHDFEVDERFQRDPSDPRHVSHVGDAEHHRGEDDWRDEQAHHLDEGIAEGLESLAQMGSEVSDQYAPDHANGDVDQS